MVSCLASFFQITNFYQDSFLLMIISRVELLPSLQIRRGRASELGPSTVWHSPFWCCFSTVCLSFNSKDPSSQIISEVINGRKSTYCILLPSFILTHVPTLGCFRLRKIHPESHFTGPNSYVTLVLKLCFELPGHDRLPYAIIIAVLSQTGLCLLVS